MTGDEFIRVAGKIAASYSDPGSCRTAIGRAYYGAFHLAKAFLAEIGIVAPKNANAHVFACCLQNSGFDRSNDIGRLLQDLYADRLYADYQLDIARVESIGCARVAVETAKRIQTALLSFGEADRSQIQAGIAIYDATISPQRLRYLGTDDTT